MGGGGAMCTYLRRSHRCERPMGCRAVALIALAAALGGSAAAGATRGPDGADARDHRAAGPRRSNSRTSSRCPLGLTVPGDQPVADARPAPPRGDGGPLGADDAGPGEQRKVLAHGRCDGAQRCRPARTR